MALPPLMPIPTHREKNLRMGLQIPGLVSTGTTPGWVCENPVFAGAESSLPTERTPDAVARVEDGRRRPPRAAPTATVAPRPQTTKAAAAPRPRKKQRVRETASVLPLSAKRSRLARRRPRTRPLGATSSSRRARSPRNPRPSKRTTRSGRTAAARSPRRRKGKRRATSPGGVRVSLRDATRRAGAFLNVTSTFRVRTFRRRSGPDRPSGRGGAAAAARIVRGRVGPAQATTGGTGTRSPTRPRNLEDCGPRRSPSRNDRCSPAASLRGTSSRWTTGSPSPKRSARAARGPRSPRPRRRRRSPRRPRARTPRSSRARTPRSSRAATRTTAH